MPVSASMLGTVWRVLESYGYDPAELIAEHIYRPNQQPYSARRLSFREYDAIVTRAANHVGEPDWGLRAAEHWHPSHVGALVGALLASASLRSSLHCAERYSRICHDHFELHIEELPTLVCATYEALAIPQLPDQVGDARMAILFKLCEMNLGRRLTPVAVSLARARPADPAPWHAFFNTRVKFGQPANSLSITVEDADTPLTGGNSELAEIHEEIMLQQLTRLDRGNFVYRTRRQIVKQLPAGRITEDTLADSLNMSKRTLHRKLRENDETFRTMLRRVRKDMAERYITDLDYTITEIAFLLGYADVSSFSRAFKGWYGFAPIRARAGQFEPR